MKPIKIKTLYILSAVILIGIISASIIIKQMIVKAASWEDLSIHSVYIQWLPEDLLKEGSEEGLNVLLMYKQNVDTYSSIYENSDVIALVSVSNRSQCTNTLQTEVVVYQVYKGEASKLISIYEPVSVIDKDAMNLNSIDLPMRENEAYLVFLKQVDDTHYNLTSSLYGRYNSNVDQMYTIEFPLNNKIYNYEDMKAYDIINFVNEESNEDSNQIYMKREAIFLEAKRKLLAVE